MTSSISRDELAEDLGSSSRHLHPQLQKTSSRYRELIDDIRIELTTTLLQDKSLTVNALSQHLNFK